MKTKNNIKNPIVDTIRGIGKLGYTESGKLHNTLKKLNGTFDIDKPVGIPTKSKKVKIACPKCKQTFLVNNPNIIPNHKKSYYYSYDSNDSKLCEGSTSQTITKEYQVIKPEIFSSCGSGRTNGEIFYRTDTVVIDFSRSILRDYDTQNVGDIYETTILDIIRYQYLRKDGRLSNSYRQEVILDGIAKPIPTTLLTVNNFIKKPI